MLQRCVRMAVLGILLAAGTATAQNPLFEGNWQLTSVLHTPPLAPRPLPDINMAITVDDDEVTVVRTRGDREARAVYRADGVSRRLAGLPAAEAEGFFGRVTEVEWQGSSLVFHHVLTSRGSTQDLEAQVIEVWTLSPGGTLLTVTKQRIGPGRTATRTLVFSRQ